MLSPEQKEIERDFQIATNLYKSKKFDDAEKRIEHLIKKFPGNVVFYNLLGLIQTGQKKFEKAIKTYEDALLINPNFAIAHNNLGNIYYTQGLKKEAEVCFKKSIKAEPRFALAYGNLGNLYKDISKYDDAIKSYKKGIECDPKLLPLYNNLGISYQNLGKYNEAENCFKDALKINPSFAIAHRQISITHKYTKEDTHLREMENLIKKNNSDNEKMELSFALGKAYEDIKNYNKAFKAFVDGNNLKRKTYDYSIKRDEDLYQNIKNVFNADFLKNKSMNGKENITPIFIIGMPRSGTSLVEQIISNHKEVYGGGELDDLSILIKKHFLKNKQIEFEKDLGPEKNNILKDIKETYISNLKNYAQKNYKFISDKSPLNLRWLGLIKLSFPNAKIIHCVRDNRDNCLSLFKNFFASGELKFAYSLSEIVSYHNLYKNLMEHWHKVLPDYIYDISYENLTSNQEQETRKLISFLNLKWDNNCLKFYKSARPIATASVAQARQPIYKDSVKSWEHYKKELESLFKNLK